MDLRDLNIQLKKKKIFYNNLIINNNLYKSRRELNVKTNY